MAGCLPGALVRGLGLLALKAEEQENTCREDFRPTEAVELGERLEKMLKPEAEKRKAQARGERRGKKKAVSGGKLPQETKAKTRDAIAEAVGMGARTYEKAKAVVAAAAANPDLRPIVDKMNETGNVDPVPVETAFKFGL